MIILLLCLAGCSYGPETHEQEVTISFSGGNMQCRSADPDEQKISDMSLMIFDENGSAEECFWKEGGSPVFSTKLVVGKRYIFCACANFGYQVYADDIEELYDIRYHLAYPDEYSRGLPMYAYQEVRIGGDSGEITVRLERLMAKISLRMDRSMLSDDVDMVVRSVRIGNCPRSASVFTENRTEDEDDCFPAGFSRTGVETDRLNRTSVSGLSGSVSLYMLENMQGKLDSHIDKDSEKTFGKDDPRRDICSYIEMDVEYMSDNYHSGEKGLIYRFYLGEDRNDLNVERNCHYQITVVPEDDGLSDNSWRVDKSGLEYSGPVGFKVHPSGYIRGNIGEKVHIWCELIPEDAPFDVGMGYMEDDKKTGIYDYVIDEDGHGATLTLTGPGRGLIYMEAGAPINDAALFVIEVNLPENSQ